MEAIDIYLKLITQLNEQQMKDELTKLVGDHTVLKSSNKWDFKVPQSNHKNLYEYD